MRIFSGYSALMFNQRELQSTARHLSETLPFLMERSGATAIVVRGKSGIALAFATSAVASEHIPIIVARKPGDQTHGDPLEAAGVETDGLRYLILDDFVSSGDTVDGIVETMTRVGSECVGVVVYQSNRPGTPIYKKSGMQARVPIIDGMATLPTLRRELAARAAFLAEEALPTDEDSE